MSASLTAREEAYVKTVSFPDAGLKLIGFMSLTVDEDALRGFNEFYRSHKAEFDALANHSYDPDSGRLRVYFPVRSAVTEVGGSGDPDQTPDLTSLRVLGRRQTDKITGVDSNVVRDGLIMLKDPVTTDHVVSGDVAVFDFGEWQMDHHGAEGGAHAMAEGKVGCMSNHGGVNCSTAFGISRGRCTFNASVCMDYNGIFTDCVRYSGGWRKYVNFIDSDCDNSLGRGHCWNEIM